VSIFFRSGPRHVASSRMPNPGSGPPDAAQRAVLQKALRNLAGVAVLFGAPKVLRLASGATHGPRRAEGLWVLRAAVAAALTPLAHHAVHTHGTPPHDVLAAIASGAPLYLLDAETRITLACHLLASLIVRGTRKVTRHWVSLLMMLSTAELLMAWLFDPTAHPRAYQRFLDGAAGFLTPANQKVLRESLRDGKPLHYTLFLPGPNLLPAVASFLVHHASTFSFKFYAKLYVWRIIHALATRRKVPWASVAVDTLRSSLFLSCYGLMASAAFSTAGYLNNFMKVTKPLLWLILAVPGLTIHLENRDRQRMLPAYCLTFVLYAWVRRIRGLGDGVLFSSLAAWAPRTPRPTLLQAMWP